MRHWFTEIRSEAATEVRSTPILGLREKAERGAWRGQNTVIFADNFFGCSLLQCGIGAEVGYTCINGEKKSWKTISVLYKLTLTFHMKRYSHMWISVYYKRRKPSLKNRFHPCWAGRGFFWGSWHGVGEGFLGLGHLSLLAYYIPPPSPPLHFLQCLETHYIVYTI